MDRSRLAGRLEKEWDTSLSGPIPNVPKSTTRVHWKCQEHGHTWEAALGDRVRGRNCPFCGNKRVWPGFNDLATIRPDISAEWDRVGNGMPASQVLAGSCKKARWSCPQGHPYEMAPERRMGAATAQCVPENRLSLPAAWLNCTQRWLPDGTWGRMEH